MNRLLYLIRRSVFLSSVWGIIRPIRLLQKYLWALSAAKQTLTLSSGIAASKPPDFCSQLEAVA